MKEKIGAALFGAVTGYCLVSGFTTWVKGIILEHEVNKKLKELEKGEK